MAARDRNDELLSAPLLNDAAEPRRSPEHTGLVATSADVRNGLTEAEAVARLAQYGPNEVPVPREPLWRLFMMQFQGTMPLVLEASCVVSAAVEDWPDFGVILAILLVNAVLGFREQLKARRALEALTDGMVKTATVRRNGVAQDLPTTQLVPGDVILLKGGDETPADVEWLEGDTLAVDTAALTGEPLPRKFPSSAYGGRILAGTTVREGEAYCVVQKTGTHTEMGAGQKDIIADRSSASVSVFEQRVMTVVRIIILVAIFDAAFLLGVQGVVRDGFREEWHRPLLVALSVLIAAVPVALPLVLQVTMAIGAYKMAIHHHAVVTRMSALQDIAGMTVLCSDKTGTLTTAKMTISDERIWVGPQTPGTRSRSESRSTASSRSGSSRRGSGTWLSEAVASAMTGGTRPPVVQSQAFAVLGLAAEMDPVHLREYQRHVLLAAALCSNADKRDDAVDGAVWRAFDYVNVRVDGALQTLLDGYEGESLSGFNPMVKRTVAVVRRKADGKRLRLAKGLVTKILDTSSGGADTAEQQWRCREVELDPRFTAVVAAEDAVLSTSGYKTIAVAVGDVGGPMYFLGLLPMIDPPRPDTIPTLRHLANAGIDVKMVTGDHLNIARETAKLIGMGDQILAGEVIRQASYARDELIFQADGFAQVLPQDKRECVLALQNRYGLVVGMTGDGVNDAPALSAAECGIAVDDATDAAKNAAAMILTSEGISAVYGAVVESRRIFARLFAYVSYRLAATIQILTFLSIIILFFDCELDPLYVILLALLNDVTMIPVAEDRQVASAAPQTASVASLIGYAATMGAAATAASLLFYVMLDDLLPGDDFHPGHANYGSCDDRAQTAIWLQVSVLAELLIFVARAPGLFFLNRPSTELLLSTTLGNAVSSVLAVYAFAAPLSWKSVGVIAVYDVAWIVVIDVVKMMYKFSFEHATQGVIYDADPEDDAFRRRDASGGEVYSTLSSVEEGELRESAGLRPSLLRGRRESHASSLLMSVGEFTATGKLPRRPSALQSGSLLRQAGRPGSTLRNGFH